MSVDEYLNLTDLDIQYLMSIDYGEHISDPFAGSAVEKNSQKEYDFEFISTDDEEVNNIPSDDDSFDEIIDISIS